MIHNETTNIWSHIGGLFVVLFLVFYVIYSYSLIDVDFLKEKLGKNYDSIHDEFLAFEASLETYFENNKPNWIQDFQEFNTNFHQ
jgi:hypothetical protein